ncbi:hypothetical protein DPEC_G00060610 [Dallia pectoralis]|uniref:Uncharacterized protein n=1 Tax=Dallia pectoralis TaxID=75939 RepID=A0ACC2H7I2_DALPE|nr:hypothetical protein DPEC_G00060610 [Dallia pectoralis]
MNNTWHVEFPYNMVQGGAYLVVFVVGLLLNIAALRAIITKRAEWTGTHIYMLNLSVADCALVLFLPFRIYDAFSRLEKSIFCTLLISTHYVNMYTSIFTVTAISIHRYLAVKFPFRSSKLMSKKVAVVVCVIIWISVLVLSIMFCINNEPDQLRSCFERSTQMPVGLVVVLLVLGYTVPLVGILFCSIQTIMVLRKEKNEEDTTLLKKNIVGIITANLIVFVICFTPIHIGFLLRHLFPNPAGCTWLAKFVHDFWLVSEWIATTNCFLDSISYYFLLKKFYSKINRSANDNMLTGLSTI